MKEWETERLKIRKTETLKDWTTEILKDGRTGRLKAWGTERQKDSKTERLKKLKHWQTERSKALQIERLKHWKTERPNKVKDWKIERLKNWKTKTQNPIPETTVSHAKTKIFVHVMFATPLGPYPATLHNGTLAMGSPHIANTTEGWLFCSFFYNCLCTCIQSTPVPCPAPALTRNPGPSLVLIHAPFNSRRAGQTQQAEWQVRRQQDWFGSVLPTWCFAGGWAIVWRYDGHPGCTRFIHVRTNCKYQVVHVQMHHMRISRLRLQCMWRHQSFKGHY